jgi:hypothetical protein
MRNPLALILGLTLIPAAAFAQADERAAMLGWINADRAAVGSPPLAADGSLDAVAEGHARDMAANGFFSHASPTSGSPGDRAEAAGIRFRMLAENIALNHSLRAAHEALMQSPGHRANLLNAGLRRVGLGLVRGPQGLFVTQLFATLPEDFGVAAASVPSVPSSAPPEVARALPRSCGAARRGQVWIPAGHGAPTAAGTRRVIVDPRALQALLAEMQQRVEGIAGPAGMPVRWTVTLPPAAEVGDEAGDDAR